MIRFLFGLLLFAASAFLAARVWLAVETIEAERAITAATLKNEYAITASLTSVPVFVDQHLALIEHQLDEVRRLTERAVKRADFRLASIQKDANIQLTQANRSIASVTDAASIALPEIAKSADTALASASGDVHSISTDVHQMAVPIASTAAQVNDVAPLFLDCEFNEDCVFNRFQGVSKATEQTMQAVAKAAPKIAESTGKIEADIQRETDAITRPKRWWQKLDAIFLLSGEVAVHLIF